ncbi:MAG: rhodanese-like domain-containing protein [Pseudomonadota bacterium]|nr:rhodanese-like domain-containing protein [Pseudomonadota bacterium]
MRKILSLLCLLLLLPAAAPAQDAVLTVDQARRLMEENADNPRFVILDVRARELFEEGHIKGAVHMNYYATNFKRLVSRLDRNATILIYCQRGRQSPMARRVMEQLRFTDLHVLQGGVHAWQEAGQPLVW